MVFFLSTCVLHWAQMEAGVGQSVSAGPGHLGWCWEDRDRLTPALSLCVGAQDKFHLLALPLSNGLWVMMDVYHTQIWISVGSEELYLSGFYENYRLLLWYNLLEMGLKSHPFTCLICNHVHLTESSDRKKSLLNYWQMAICWVYELLLVYKILKRCKSKRCY